MTARRTPVGFERNDTRASSEADDFGKIGKSKILGVGRAVEQVSKIWRGECKYLLKWGCERDRYCFKKGGAFLTGEYRSIFSDALFI